MEKFFSRFPPFPPFQTFSQTHIITLVIILLAGAVIIVLLKIKAGQDTRNRFRLMVALLLVTLELFDQIWMAYTGAWSLRGALPLHLCRIGMFLTAAMLVTGNRFLYELSYFWSLGGATAALMTPAISRYNFPHILFFKFFIYHGCLILATLYMTIVEEYRPDWKSVLRALGVTHAYIAVIALTNHLLGSNYLYLCENPGKNTLLGLFGPWPEYLLPLWLMMVGTFFLLYLPYAIRGIMKRRIGA